MRRHGGVKVKVQSTKRNTHTQRALFISQVQMPTSRNHRSSKRLGLSEQETKPAKLDLICYFILLGFAF
jgi:hypothetical protein